MGIILSVYIALYSIIQVIVMLSIYFVLGCFTDVSDKAQIVIIWFSGLFSAILLFYLLLFSDINLNITIGDK